jgi:branched-chain amino acid transport system substrate-binding protein
MNNPHFICLFLAISLWCSSAAADEPIKLGFIGSLSGEIAGFSNDGRRAVEMAIEDMRSSNFMPGKTLSVVVEDGQCSGKQSTVAASKLVNIDHVKAIIQCGCSTEVLGAAPIVERSKVILLSSASESAAITFAGDYVFRISPNARIGGDDLRRWITKEGFHRIAAITENTDYALNFRETFAAGIIKPDVSMVEDVMYNSTENDFRVMLLRMRAKKPDVVFVNPQSGQKGGLIVRQLRELGWSVPIFGNYSFGMLDAPAAAGGYQVLEGVCFVDYPVVNSTRGKDLLERYQKRYGPPQSDFNVAATYDAAFMIASAIKEASYDGTAIRDYFYSLPSYEGLLFSYRFDKYGDAEGVHYSKKRIRNGKVEVIEP